MEVRQAALECLVKILEHNNSYEETLEYYANRVENPPDLTNTVAGAIKRKLSLDYYIERISTKKVKKLSPAVRNILRLGIFELEYLKRPDFAVVNSYVDICNKKDKKSSGFVNAVLRNFTRKREEISIPPENLSIKYSHPQWMIEKWKKNYGKDVTEKILEYNNTPPKTVLRINRLKTDKQHLMKLFTENNTAFKESGLCEDCLIMETGGSIKAIPGFEEGLWAVQGETSAMVATILSPQKNERILDLCAAPGAKTTHIASIMGNTGQITAVDVSHARLEKISQNLKRLGIKNVQTIEGDASTIKLKKDYDRILADVPCSNTGVLGKRPDARWNRKPEDIAGLADLQLKILNNAAEMLKPGGVLVYSTCSIEPEENTEVIEKFLNSNKGFTLGSSRLFLQSEYETDGFFIAQLHKKLK